LAASKGAHLRHLSSQLSGSIISEAVEQVGQLEGCRQLLALLLNRENELELVFRSYQEEAGKQRQAQDENLCLLCDGSGSLDFKQRFLIRVKLNAGQWSSEHGTAANSKGCAGTELKVRNQSIEGPFWRLAQWLERQSGELAGELGSGQVCSNCRQEFNTTEGANNQNQSEATQREEGAKEQQPANHEDRHTNLVTEVGTTQSRPHHQSNHLNRLSSSRELSSNIQRMMRMDTLKLRKLKKRQVEQGASQLPQPALEGAATNSSSVRFAEELERASGRPGCEHVAIVEEEGDEEGEAEAEEGEAEGEEEKGPAWASGHPKCKTEPELAEPKRRESSVCKTSENYTLGNDGCHSLPPGAASSTNTRSADQRLLQDEMKVGSSGSGSDKQRRPSAPEARKQRSSLASLLSELAPSSRATESPKKRFSFNNPFSNFSFVSPFSSPTKREPNKRCELKATKGQRSQSAGSQTQNSKLRSSSKTEINCSCFKSSPSGQSLESAPVE